MHGGGHEYGEDDSGYDQSGDYGDDEGQYDQYDEGEGYEHPDREKILAQMDQHLAEYEQAHGDNFCEHPHSLSYPCSYPFLPFCRQRGAHLLGKKIQ